MSRLNTVVNSKKKLWSSAKIKGLPIKPLLCEYVAEVAEELGEGVGNGEELRIGRKGRKPAVSQRPKLSSGMTS